MGIWYSYKGKNNNNNPPYYDLDGVEWYDKLKNDLPRIQQKTLSFLRLGGLNMLEYPTPSMVEGTKWEGIPFMFWKIRFEETINKGKDLFEYFDHIPGITALSVSILQAKTRIKGHYGDTDAIYRIHIPIFIPTQLPECGLTVGGITRSWAEDNIIVFCDAHFHEAWNMSDKPRIVIIMDVIKEEFLSQADEICANVLSSFKYREFVLKYKFIKKFPGWLKDIIRRSLKIYHK